LRVLAHPMTMTELAGRLHCAPSTATYHCNSLEASGLLVRDRQGSVIWTMRTTRAERLIDLLTA
jgi:DNA-binding MarR family transcriptional regulator